MEQIVNFVMSANLPVLYILLIAFASTFVENVFPPAPGDTVTVFLGALIGLGKIDFVSLLLVSTVGSTAGFALMFILGRYFGYKIIDSNRFKFINEQNMEKPRRWFRKYGYKIVVVNRFLSGTRAIISFAAGASELRFRYTVLLACVSSLIWNALMIYLGMMFGSHWQRVNYYLNLYGQILIPVLIALIVGWFVYKYVKSRKEKEKNN